MKNYIENRELILSSFGEDRKIIKELFLSILNGGFKEIYSDNKQTNNYLKLEKFKDFKIVTRESQVDKQIKKPNFSCRNIINENLTILEMEKTSVTYNYPILIGSIIFQYSKVHMFNYLYKFYPRFFGDYKVLYMDTDCIYAK